LLVSLVSLVSVALFTFATVLCLGFVYEQRSRRDDARRFPPLGQLIDVGGHRLHFLVRGTEAPTVVFEQGAGGPSLAWLGVFEAVSEFARVCLYDRAGYQWSESVPGPRSIEERTKDLHALLLKAEVPGPYVLVAHSYGGFLVRLFAKEYPASVAGLVLIDTPHESGYFEPDVLSFYSKMRWMLLAAGALSWAGLPRILTRWLSKPDPSLPAGRSEQINSGMVRREYFAAASDDIASLERAASWLVKPDAFPPLGDLPLAVVTHGKPFPGPFAVLEKSWRAGQEHLAALSTNSVFRVAEQANHMVQNDDPQAVIEAIRSVVARVRNARSAGVTPSGGSRTG